MGRLSADVGEQIGTLFHNTLMKECFVPETGNQLPINDNPVVKVVRLDPKLGCTGHQSTIPCSRMNDTPS